MAPRPAQRPAPCRDLRRNEQQTQIGYLDPPRLPGEAETRKTCSLATEHQAQQQRVYQQREQQRVGQSPLLGTHALPVGASLEPVEFNRNPPSLHGHCCLRRAGSHRVRRACRPDAPVGHDLARVPPRHLRTASGPWSRRLPPDLGVDSHMSERTVEATLAIAHGFCAPMSRANQSGALDPMFELGTSARDAPAVRPASLPPAGRSANASSSPPTSSCVCRSRVWGQRRLSSRISRNERTSVAWQVGLRAQ